MSQVDQHERFKKWRDDADPDLDLYNFPEDGLWLCWQAALSVAPNPIQSNEAKRSEQQPVAAVVGQTASSAQSLVGRLRETAAGVPIFPSGPWKVMLAAADELQRLYAPTKVYAMCERHMGHSFAIKASYVPPAVQVCPICEEEQTDERHLERLLNLDEWLNATKSAETQPSPLDAGNQSKESK